MADNRLTGLNRWLTEFLTPVSSSSNEEEVPDVVTTPLGKLRGCRLDGVSVYRGIPYAQGPSGDRRFSPPASIQPWQGVKDATQYGPMSYQSGAGHFSEDCLYLNIWSPEPSDKPSLPVYVFIHGGGYVLGSGSQPLYEGKHLSKRGMVVVTLNYRLGTLGFLPSSAAFDEHGTSGNWGLLDIIAALKWVQENIRAFGGDPSRVTVGGESAGSYAVSTLITSPLAQGLFGQAILQSGSLPNATAVAPENVLSFQQAKLTASRFFARLGLTDNASGLAELRKMPVEKILAVTSETVLQAPQVSGFWPVPDGHVYHPRPAESLKIGAFNKVKLLAGFNTDEGSLFVPPAATEEQYITLVCSAFGSDGKNVLQRFPVNNDHSAASRMNQLITLGLLRSGLYLYADALARHDDVYMYHFDYLDPDIAPSKLGVIHGSELKFIFHNLINSGTWNDEAHQIARVMQDAWVNFIKYGNPNAEKGTTARQLWKKYDPNSPQDLRISKEIKMQSVADWDDVVFINHRLQTQR